MVDRMTNFAGPDQIAPLGAPLDNFVTVTILSLRTGRPWQTVQTQIRLLLEEQSDQGLHCLPLHLHLLDIFFYGKTSLFEF